MSKTLKELLSEAEIPSEFHSKIANAISDEWVPKDRLDSKIAKFDELKHQFDELKESTGKIDAIQTENKNLKTQLREVRIEHLALDAIRDFGAINPKKTLKWIDKSKLKLDAETGELIGLMEQLEADKAEDPMFYYESEPSAAAPDYDESSEMEAVEETHFDTRKSSDFNIRGVKPLSETKVQPSELKRSKNPFGSFEEALKWSLDHPKIQ
jgi:hypothetical protein